MAEEQRNESCPAVDGVAHMPGVYKISMVRMSIFNGLTKLRMYGSTVLCAVTKEPDTMPKRRANGEGNIGKRKDGRWEGRYTVGRNPETGNYF